MQKYCRFVPFEIASLMWDAGYRKAFYEDDYCYVNSEKLIIDNDYSIHMVLERGTLFLNEYDNIKNGELIPAPTYAEALDWLMDNNIFVNIDISENQIATILTYENKIMYLNKGNFTDDTWFEFVKQAIKVAIEKIGEIES